MFLSGEYDHKIDSDTNRISLKVELRKMLDESGFGNSFFITHGHKGVLSLYPEDVYRKLMFKGIAQGQGTGLTDGPFVLRERFNLGLTAKCEIDKQGRLLLPQKFIRRAMLGGDVVLIGLYDHLEIWDPERWEQYLQDNLEQHSRQQEQTRKEVFEEALALEEKKIPVHG
ncbi:MAG: division/cell wall cluster transcriptional repressor MraZ [Phycisphaerae bacterium]|jgi:MraZ protein